MACMIKKTRLGVTLVELMTAMVIMSIGILGMVGAFRYINIGIQSPKGRSLANNLAQEKIEVLKNKSYFRVMVSTAFDDDHNFDPAAYRYDVAPNGSEYLNVGGINFTRRVLIRKVSEDPYGALQYLDWNDPDTGLKEILVYVSWFEAGTWKKMELRNLRGNPDRVNLGAIFTGTVLEAGGSTPPIQGAVVRAQENPARYDTTDASGAFSFAIEKGSYTLQASRPGYFPGVSPLYVISTTQNHAFTLTKMSSGTITGTAWMRDHLVISQVVGSSVNSHGNYQEWVEVYNPTTWTWTMATGLGHGSNKVVHFGYKEAGSAMIVPDIDYRTLSIGSGAYFLFANTGTVQAAGVVKPADGVYATGSDFNDMDDVIKTGNPSSAGFVVIGNEAASQQWDLLGWGATSNGSGTKKYAEQFEGLALAQSIGLEVGEGYTRRTTASGITAGQGRCYDSNNNNNDFVGSNPVSYQPHNSSDSEACASGTPAYGAAVFANDGLSNSTQAAVSGAFTLSGVATGYWTLYVSSGLAISTGGTYGGTSSGFASAAGTLLLSSSNIFGFISGTVTGVNGVGIDNIKVAASGRQTATNASGRYVLPADPGEQTVWANYQTENVNYIETSSAGVMAALGQIAGNVDFVLQAGGKLRGWVTTNGVDPLPNVPVSAFKGGVEQGNGITDSNGYFLIWGTGISTGSYDVAPQLEDGETSSPSTHTITLAAGNTLFVGTYTVSGALGTISGAVTYSSAAINTGVLVYATTATLTGSPIMPPTLDAASRSGSVIYYAVSSNAQGVYSLPVRGGSTYNVYAWYTTWDRNDVPTITVKQSTAAVTAGGAITRDFSW